MNIEIKHLWLHKCPKKWNQYTLIALVITIIVLLILAGVTIATLTGDNGLLQKATTAKQEYNISEIIEKVRIDIVGDSELINNRIVIPINKLLYILKGYYNEDSVASIQRKQINDEEYRKNTKILTNDGRYEILLSRMLDGIIVEFPIFDPGDKKPYLLEKGDIVSIGPEEFSVIRNKKNKLTLLPVYNITLDENKPRQDINAGMSQFATSCYWQGEGNGINLDMNDDENCIQKYIKAYENTLKSYGATNFITRVPFKSDLWRDNIDEKIRNPKNDNAYWIGTNSDAWPGTSALMVGKNGTLISAGPTWNGAGVRPLVEFEIDIDDTCNLNNLTIGTAINTDKYGWKVKNYNVSTSRYSSGIWRLFYQDDKFTYLITDGSIEYSDWSEYRYKYRYFSDIITDIVKKLNPKMKPLFEDLNFINNLNNDALNFTSWLGDTTDEGIWEEYKNDDAVFAMGGPTIELFAASFNNRINKSNILSVELDKFGYQNPSCSVKDEQNHGIYCRSKSNNNKYWVFTSPEGKYTSSQITQRYTVFERMSTNTGYGFIVSPIVCIPTNVFNEKYTYSLCDE